MTVIAPSILSADFWDLGRQVRRALAGGADWIHIDVMDGRFVPPLTMGPLVVEALKQKVGAPLDAHLMIERPERQIEAFARAGAEWITVQVEACPHLHRLLWTIKELGARAGVALNPATPLSALDEVLSVADLILVMSVDPGWGGQKLIESCLEKVRTLRQQKDENGFGYLIQIDGGVKADNARRVVAAGAEVLVVGTAVFRKDLDPAAGVRAIRASLKGLKTSR
jgi:ribulose-phosphate 3-epimerase